MIFRIEPMIAAVSFGVALASAVAGDALSENRPGDPSAIALDIETPKSNRDVRCTLTKKDGGKLMIGGSSSGLYKKGLQLLLFVNPQHPNAGGWYLQFGTNGVQSFLEDGTWQGVAQIGSGTYPPKGGEIISLAVVAVSENEANTEFERARKHPDRPRPGGLPRPPAGHLAFAKNVKIVLQRSR